MQVHFPNFSQRDYIVIQRIQNLRYDVRIHNYAHTYNTACVQYVNVGLAQARPTRLAGQKD